MMGKILFRFFLIAVAANLALCAGAQSSSQRTITLKNGSVIKGEVTQLADGVYTLKTENLGEVRVAEAEVVSITPGSEGASVPAADTQGQPLKDQVQRLQVNLLSDPEIMAEMQNIMQDPEIRGVLSDPAFMQAIMSYNPDQIQQNEKTRYLLQNPKFQSLMEEIRRKLPNQSQ